MSPKKYWSPSVTTDVVIFTIENKELKVLLIKRARGPYKNFWALPGSFIQKNETSKDAALRTLANKAGVKNVYIEQLYTFDENRRDPRGQIMSVTYFALVPRQNIKFEGLKDLQRPTFLSVRKLPHLAFDHKEIINYASQRLQSKLEYTNVVFSLLSKYFTIHQLQTAYEIILGQKLDKRNFRKKFMELDLIKPTRKVLSGTRQRPAKLYQFKSRKRIELKKFF